MFTPAINGLSSFSASHPSPSPLPPVSATERIPGEGIWVSPHNLYINAQIYLKCGAQSGWGWWTDRGSADLRWGLYSTYAIVGGEISLVLHQLLRYPWLKRVLWNMSLERDLREPRNALTSGHTNFEPIHAKHLVHIREGFPYGCKYLLIFRHARGRAPATNDGFGVRFAHATTPISGGPVSIPRRFGARYNKLTSASLATIRSPLVVHSSKLRTGVYTKGCII